jgi:hypothetical protein
MNDSATVNLLANGSARIFFGQLMLLMYIVRNDFIVISPINVMLKK